jgi:deoxyribose-phosphate aldolase
MLARLIDHTILAADASAPAVLRFCVQARQHGFFSVCVNPAFVALVSEALRGSEVRACSVVGFPLGAAKSAVKAFEAEQAVRDGADEIDMVLAIGRLKDGDLAYVRDDIAVVRRACAGRVLKVIIETCLLNEAEKRLACVLACEAGAEFVKTSTGFGAAGASVADVALMRTAVGPMIGVKASGGIRTRAAAEAMVAAGATRIGTSSGLAIIGVAEVAGGY